MLAVESAGTCVFVTGPEVVLSKILAEEFLFSYIPDVNAYKSEGVIKKNDYILSLTKGNVFNLSCAKNMRKISVEVTEQTTIKDVITIIDYYFDFVRAQKGVYTIHGSSVCSNNSGILLIGGVSGIGKTTVAYNLVNNHNLHFIADEKVLINERLKIIGGANLLQKNKSLNKNLEKIKNTSYKPADLKFIIQPITNKNGHVFVDKWNQEKTDFHIYEELTRKIRGNSRRVNLYKIPIRSFDNNTLSKSRAALSKKISQKVPAYCIYGDPRKVAKAIYNLVKS